MANKVLFSDLDGTLIEVGSAWETLHRHFGVDGSENYNAYFNKDISYSEWMNLDIKLWMDKIGRVHLSELKKAFDGWRYLPNARDFVPIVKSKGYDFVILSAGFDFLAEQVGKELGADAYYANGLETDEVGCLTGEGICKVRLGEKYKIVRKYCKSNEINPLNCVALTDKYDADLLYSVGKGIVIGQGDDQVNKAADVRIEEKDLLEVLTYL
jgi:HAD superfamily PSPase-like hydrolase